MMGPILMLLLWLQPDAARNQYLEDYRKIVAVYKTTPSMSYTITYKSFDTNAQRPDTSFQGKYMCKGQKLYSKVGGAETFKDNEYLLAIDHVHKIMFLNRASSMNTDKTPAAMVDSIMATFKCAIIMTDLPNTEKRRYEIEYPMNDGIKGKVIFEFDKKSYLISRFVMYMPPEEDLYKTGKVNTSFRPFVEFLYSSYGFSDIPEATFATSRFFSLYQKDAKLKPPYTNYQLINSLFLNSQNR